MFIDGAAKESIYVLMKQPYWNVQQFKDTEFWIHTMLFGTVEKIGVSFEFILFVL